MGEVIEFFNKKSKNGIYPPKSVFLIGGEPLLPHKEHMNNVKKILDFLHTAYDRLLIQVVTNGYNLEKYIDLFQQYNKFDWFFNITVGITEEYHSKERILKSEEHTNTFSKINENILLLYSNLVNITIMIRMNFGKNFREKFENKKLVYSIRESFPEIRFDFSPIIDNHSHMEISIPFIELIKEYYSDKEFREKFSMYF